jgi:hypothetical protein
MSTSDPSRRAFVRRSLYVAPAILTLAASPQFAKAGSYKPAAAVEAPIPIPPQPGSTPASPQAPSSWAGSSLESPDEPLPPSRRSARRQDAAADSPAPHAGMPWTAAATHPQSPAASSLPADLRITEIAPGPLWCVDPKL